MGNKANKGDFAFDESPKLCVVDLPIIEDKLLEKFLQDNRKRQQRGQWGRNFREGGSSKYKGVHYQKEGQSHTGKWHAQIYCLSRFNHKAPISLGCYEDEKEAALAYDKAALQLFGEYARTNQMMFPEDFKDFSPKSKTSI